MGLEYDETCVLDDPSYFDDLQERSEQRAVPVTIIDDKIFVGFNSRVERRIKRMLRS